MDHAALLAELNAVRERGDRELALGGALAAAGAAAREAAGRSR